MIPDEPFNFNHLGALSNFDDHEVRLRHMQQQNAKPTLEFGRHLLSVCPVCKQPWYKAGRREYPCLTPEQLAFLCAVLHVDIRALYLLPRALCTICSTLYLGGMFSAETYPHSRGYCFLWESVSPRRIQLLAMICRGEGLTLDTLVQMAPETFTESTSEIRSVLAWLETCPFTDAMRALTDEQGQLLARRCPPGNAADGRRHLWRGYAWETICSPLGGDALISLAVALPTRTLPPFASLHMGWSVLARAMRTVL